MLPLPSTAVRAALLRAIWVPQKCRLQSFNGKRGSPKLVPVRRDCPQRDFQIHIAQLTSPAGPQKSVARPLHPRCDGSGGRDRVRPCGPRMIRLAARVILSPVPSCRPVRFRSLRFEDGLGEAQSTPCGSQSCFVSRRACALSSDLPEVDQGGDPQSTASQA